MLPRLAPCSSSEPARATTMAGREDAFFVTADLGFRY
jgi:hypothetical protein